MTVAEPVTLLTDYALAATTGYLAWKLYQAHDKQVSRRCWSAGFAALALAALAGGTHHGFAPYFGPALLAATWKFTVYCVGIFGLAMLAGSIIAVCGGAVRRVFLATAALKFLAYAVVMLGRDAFEFVVADTGGAMAGLLLLHGWKATTRNDAASRWVLVAVALSALAAAVQYGRVALHAHFNHNDLYHVIQIAAMVTFYKAGKLMRDAISSTRQP
ncbi:MAG: hypothetical protein HY322_08050 [Betaproteobacteria bacterium]|nr:hypothetical protein [Betaproteobacteria bacterium]